MAAVSSGSVSYTHLDVYKRQYPHSADAVWEFKAEYFEGLTRTLFIAAPLIHDDPELTVAGYRLRDYYKSHILRSCIPGDPQSVGSYEELQEMTGDPLRSFQQTVETCALVICLWVCKEQMGIRDRVYAV